MAASKAAEKNNPGTQAPEATEEVTKEAPATVNPETVRKDN